MGRRRNLRSIDDATARRLLAEYLPVARALRPLFARLDDATYRAAWEDAILEGFITHNASRAAESTWVRKVIFWRLSEAARGAPFPAESLGTDPALVNGVDPEEAFWRATVVHLLSYLSIRQQQIVDGRMRGETYEELGSQLGISHTQAWEEGKTAFQILRDLLEDSGVD